MRNAKSKLISAVLFSLIFIIIYNLLQDLLLINFTDRQETIIIISLVIIGLFTGLLLETFFRVILNRLQVKMKKLAVQKLAVVFLGVISGLIVTLLSSKLFWVQYLDSGFAIVINLILILFITYVFYIKENELISLLFNEKNSRENKEYITIARPVILDTSVIIDGRILNIYQNSFLEGKVIIPSFVLKELQSVADSQTSSKRRRGKKGLSTLSSLQDLLGDKVKIVKKAIDNNSVDYELINISSELNARLITNDVNLGQLAELHGITVLNVNELANSLKPIFLPGDRVEVEIIKEGNERGQGIAYFDDGSMIVVEKGKYHIGEKINVVISSILKRDTGRMFFADPLNNENK